METSFFSKLKEKHLYYKNNITKLRGKKCKFFDTFGASAMGSNCYMIVGRRSDLGSSTITLSISICFPRFKTFLTHAYFDVHSKVDIVGEASTFLTTGCCQNDVSPKGEIYHSTSSVGLSLLLNMEAAPYEF